MTSPDCCRCCLCTQLKVSTQLVFLKKIILSSILYTAVTAILIHATFGSSFRKITRKTINILHFEQESI